MIQQFKDFDLKISDAIDVERMIKSDDEISKMKKAADIAHKSLIELDVRDKQEKGFQEWDCAYRLGYIMRENGANIESFDTIFASGATSSLPHSVPRHHTTRTFLYSERQEEISNIVLEAHDKAIKAVKEGIKACEVDKVARDIISEYGYGDNFIHTTGHSLGLDIHERPTVALRDKTVLEKTIWLLQ